MVTDKQCSRWLCGIVLAIAALIGAFVQNVRADLLVSSLSSVLRYDEMTGAFLGVFVAPGSGGLDNASGGMAFGPDGNLYVASFGPQVGESSSRAILRYNGVTGTFIDVFVPPGSGGLGAPNDVTFGPDGHLYIADGFFGTNSILRCHGITGAFIDVFATGGGLQQPNRLTFGPDGNLFVGNATTSDVLRYHGDTGLPFPAQGQNGAIFVPGIPGPFNTMLAFGSDGNLYVSSGATADVLRYNGTTGVLIGPFALNANTGDMVFGPDGNLYINNYLGDSVLRYNGPSGAFIDTFVAPGSGGLSRPSGLIFTLFPTHVNDLVSFEPLPSTFTFMPDPTGCPVGFVGTFSFEARLANISDRLLSDLLIEVTELTRGNLLQNADGGPGGVGAQLTVPQQDGFTDGVLSPEEFVDVPFIICLTQRQPFTFVVDVFGIVDASTDAQARVLPVPGTSDPWLGGMPAGSTASFSDVAPTQVASTGLRTAAHPWDGTELLC